MTTEQLVPVDDIRLQEPIDPKVCIPNSTSMYEITPIIESSEEIMASAPNRSSFVSRVTEIPMINTTLGHLSRYYTSGRDSSRFVRFGTDTIEYSARLVSGAFEPQLRSLDSYAGRQLELFENGYTRIVETPRNIVGGFSAWGPTSEMKLKLEQTLQGLKNAETYVDFLMGRMRDAAAQAHKRIDNRLDIWHESVKVREIETELKAQKLRESISREVIQTLRNVVDLINSSGSLLPIPGQATLKKFLLSLPERLTSCSDENGTSKVILLANDAVVSIKTLTNIIAQYLDWANPVENPTQ